MQLGDSVNERCRGLLDNIATKTVWSKHSEVKIANSIWVKDGFDVKKDFIETNRRYFDALVEMAEFNKQTIGHINDWCSENTNGKIPSIIDRFNDSDRMLLINALYFKHRLFVSNIILIKVVNSISVIILYGRNNIIISSL